LYFARKVLLVEGNTERIALPLAFKALGQDLNMLGVSVVGVGGKTKMPLFIKVCQAIEIPFCVVADEDICPIDPAWRVGRRLSRMTTPSMQDGPKTSKMPLTTRESSVDTSQILRRFADYEGIFLRESIGFMRCSLESKLTRFPTPSNQ
jgi:predicted ATP-dependent endonuclease of OLD family